MLVSKLLTSISVLVSGIVFNRLNDLMISLTCLTCQMADSMFYELKEVKYFKEMTDFKSLIL